MAALRSSDGAILDPDDRLADVVDDREQLAVCLNDDDVLGADRRSMGLNLRGDGTSASSNSGSPSPDFLHRERYIRPPPPPPPSAAGQQRKDIEVTGQEPADLLLQVRRGSEPALNRLSPASSANQAPTNQSNVHHQDYKVTLFLLLSHSFDAISSSAYLLLLDALSVVFAVKWCKNHKVHGCHCTAILR